MMRTLRWTATATALVVCAVVHAGAAGAQPVFGPSQDPVAGSQLFEQKGCAKCHAINGVGGKIGPDLAKIQKPRTFYDLAAAMWNHLPRMAERMKQMGIDRPKLDARETADLVGFLYTLSYFDAPGNPDAGKRLFTEKHCVLCHQVGGVGGTVGPSLDGLKQFVSPIFISTAMWNHGPQMTAIMKARGIERPAFTAPELRDIIAYLAPASARPTGGAVYVLPGRAERGRTLFAEKQCVECHSVGGAGGRVGPDFVDREARLSPLEFAAAMWNKIPAMNAAMQQRGLTPQPLKPEDMADIVAYLYSVRYFADPGSITRGWALATEKGCLVCHGVFGERGKPASDLTRAKGMDSPAGVIAALWNHTLVQPPAIGGKKPEWPRFRPQEMADLVSLLQSLVRR